MPFEDYGIMRGIPSVTSVEPSDSTMLSSVLRKIADIYGVFYIRLLRKSAVKLYGEGSEFEIGKAVKLKEGSDVTVIASGIMVAESVKAYNILKNDGINARVIDMFTLKPIDKNIIIEAAEETGAVVTAENHNIINGLASAVSEVLVETKPVPMEKVGVMDLFGQVGKLDYLKQYYKLTAQDIVSAVKKVVKRKI